MCTFDCVRKSIFHAVTHLWGISSTGSYLSCLRDGLQDTVMLLPLQGIMFFPTPWKALFCHHMTQLRSWAGQRLFQGPRHTLATSPCCLTKQRWTAALLAWPSLEFQQAPNEYLTESWKKHSGVAFTDCSLLPSWWSPDQSQLWRCCSPAASPVPSTSSLCQQSSTRQEVCRETRSSKA